MNLTALPQKFVAYLKQVKIEGKKINWPTRQRTLHYSLIVIAISLAVALLLGGFDFVFSSMIKIMVRIFS